MAEQPTKGRETFVALLLVLLVGGGFFLFLNFISFGFFFHVGVIFGLVMLIGALHYFLWGHALSREVAGEREELRLREGMDAASYDE